MVMRRGIADAEADRHLIQEQRFTALLTEPTEIIADMEQQFVTSGDEPVARQRRRVEPAIVIGLEHAETDAVIEIVQLHPYTRRRPAVGGIQDMRGQITR